MLENTLFFVLFLIVQDKNLYFSEQHNFFLEFRIEMKKIFIAIILLTQAFSLSGQNQRISGIVVSNLDFTPLKNVEVCINHEFHCINTSKQGRFFTLISNEVKIDSITFSLSGYRDTTLYFDDSITDLIKVVMDTARTYSLVERNEKPFLGAVLSVGIDQAKFDFGMFTPYFPVGSVDSLEANYLMVQFNYDMIINRFQFGFRFGLSGGENEPLNDSIQIKTRSNLYDLHCSYSILRTKLITLGPMVGLKWYRQRLQVYDSRDKILLTNYLQDKELDIRFNHLSSFVGLNFMLKQNDRNNSGGLIIGGYVGYLIPLNSEPWIRTKHNKIYAFEEVKLPQLNFGIYFGVGNDYPRRQPQW